LRLEVGGKSLASGQIALPLEPQTFFFDMKRTS